MNIYLKAYLGCNYGDDYMILELLRNFSKIKFYLNCSPFYKDFYEKFFCDYDNLIFTDFELYQIFDNYPKNFFKGVLLLGGSVLMGSREAGIFFRERNISTLTKLKDYGTNYWIVGCNVGPFISNTTENTVKKEIQIADLIVTRDQTSYNYCKSINNKKVLWTKDILWTIGNAYKNESKAFNLGITLFYSDTTEEGKFKTVNFWKNLIDNWIKKNKRNVALFAFSVGEQNDHGLCDQIVNLSKYPENITIISHKSSNPEQFLKSISSCERMIGIRFHGVVLSISCNVPVIPIAYNNKTEQLCKDLNCSHLVNKIEDFEKIEDTTDFLLENRNYFALKTDIYSNQKSQMEILKDYLEEEGI